MLYLKNSFLSYNYSLKEADICIIGVPFDYTSLNPGSRYGPLAIREALKLIEGHHQEFDFDVFEKLKVCDLGNLEIVPGSYELTAERIKETIKEVREKNPEVFFLFLGGEHLISLPIIETLKPETVMQFDAHADLRGNYLGNEFSNSTWAFYAARKFNLVHRGVRSFSKEEEKLREKIKKNKIYGKIYLTVDIDVFDPSIAPETGFIEFDGWSFSEFKNNLKELEKGKLIGADIVEVSPQNFQSKTAMLAANVVKEILGFIVSNV